jgi:replicative DNA helicase
VNKYDINLEQEVLAILLMDYETAKHYQFLTNKALFYSDANKIIYDAVIIALNDKKAIDVLIVTSILKDKNQLEVIGGVYYITKIVNLYVNSKNIDFYVDRLKELANHRELDKVCSGILHNKNNSTYQELIDEFKNKLMTLENDSTQLNSSVLLKNFLSGYGESLEQQSEKPIPTNFEALDDRIVGLELGNQIVIGARPSQGKTAFAVNLMLKMELPTLFFSYEMNINEVVRRFLAVSGNVSIRELKAKKLDDSSWQKITNGFGKLSDKPIYINDCKKMTIEKQIALCEREIKELGIKLIVTDYIGLIRSSQRHQNRQEEVAYISRSLKQLAKDNNVIVVTLAQLSRATEQRADRKPILSDLRDSGQIEQDADFVFFMHDFNLIIAKARDGALGEVQFYFVPETTKFEKYIGQTRDYIKKEKERADVYG